MRFEDANKHITDETAKLGNYLSDIYKVAESAINESDVLSELIPNITYVTGRIAASSLFAFDSEQSKDAAVAGFKAGLSLTWQLATAVELRNIEKASETLGTTLEELKTLLIIGGDIDEPRDELYNYIILSEEEIDDLEAVLFLAFAEHGFVEADEESRYFILWGKVGAALLIEALQIHTEEQEDILMTRLEFESIIGDE